MPLVSIPYIITHQDTKRHRRNVQLAVTGVIVLFALGVVLLHFLYEPLDIMWLKFVKTLNIS